MTRQETFDTVVAHLRAQNEKSGAAECHYRLEAGTKILRCAVGCLIPDDKYHPALEGKHVTNHTVIAVLPKDVDLDLLTALQSAHDGHQVEAWETVFKDIAREYKLRYEEPCPK